MIEITPSLSIDDSEIQLDFVRASGPGGQNVNKVSTAAQLRFDVCGSHSLTDEVKQRLVKLAGSRMTDDGVLVIEAKRFRTQEQNRIDALARLVALIQQALVPPKVRRKTRPSRTSSAARVDSKVRRGAVKRGRKYNAQDWED
jgi:ribosome-associated protein